jgi:transcriptional regulator with XRE-family HTH domain
MVLSERLRSLRQAHGLSQEAVARRADMGLRGYSDLERGVATDPHYSTLAAIAQALGTTVAELVGEEPAAPKASAPSAGAKEAEKLQRITQSLAALGVDQEQLTARLREIKEASEASEVGAEEVAKMVHEVAEDVAERVQETLEGLAGESDTREARAEKQTDTNGE